MSDNLVANAPLTKAELARALAPVAIGLGLKLVLMAGMRSAIRNSVKQMEAEQAQK